MPSPLSNEEFGRRVGVSHSMASRIRTGKHRPSLEVAARISAEFGVPLAAVVAACLEGGVVQAALLTEAAPRLAKPLALI